MRCFAPARMLTRVSLVACLMIAGASGLAWAQSGTLQVPAHKPAAAAPAKPAAAARPAAPQPATPVVQPHGPVHPIKPPEERHPHTSLPLPPPDPFASPPATPPATAAVPAKPEEQEKPAGTGLPLPRFAALRSDDVNLRAGPGFRYPIEWVYKRRDLPMEIEREFEVWRLVVAPDGIRGWIHQATLTGLRTFMVQGADATLRAEPRDDAAPVAILKVGVIGRIRSCQAGNDWCRLQVGDYRGFLKRSQFWGTLPDEVVAP